MDNLTAELILDRWYTVKLEAPPTVVGANDTLPVRVQLINVTFVLEVVERLYHIYKFKNFIFFISTKLNLHNPAATEFFNRFWMTYPLVPRMMIRDFRNDTNPVKNLISTPALVLIYTTDREDPIMEAASNGLLGMHWLKTIFILFPRLSSSNYNEDPNTLARFSSILNGVLNWAWLKQFTNALLLTLEDNVFYLSPYPTRTIVNKTQSWHVRNFFRPYDRDMQGYVIATPILIDVPRVFKGADGKTIYGTSANYFLGFLKFVNATLKDDSASVAMRYFELNKLLQLIAQGAYETIIHSFTDLSGEHSISISYPIGINDWCLMVPFNNESLQEFYIREALEDNVWLLSLLLMLYVCLGIWLCSPLRPRDLSAAVLQCICTMTNSPPIGIIKTDTPRMRFVFVLLFLLGLVFSNMYISKVASYLTIEPQARQLNSLQDIIDADLRIMVQNFEYDLLARTPQQYSARFLQQVDVVSSEVIQHHRDLLNTSYGYVITTDRWNFIKMQQGHLKRPVFRLTNICSGPFYHVYPMHLDSHLRLQHKNFIMIAQQAGLSQLWKWQTLWEGLRMGRLNLIVVDEQPKPLTMSFYSSMMLIWCLGLVLAGFAFALEMKWYDYALHYPHRKLFRNFKSILNIIRNN